MLFTRKRASDDDESSLERGIPKTGLYLGLIASGLSLGGEDL